MPKVSPIQDSFNSGEITPLLYGRPTLDTYASALRVCINNIPLVQGPLTRRPGLYFCDEAKDSTTAARVVGFRFSTTQAYVLEFGDQYVRFKRNNAPVHLPAQAITQITQANPAVLTYTGADTFANGDMVDVSGVGGMWEVNARRFTVSNVNTVANTFELTGVDSTGFNAYVSGGSVEGVYTVATPYAESELFQLKFTQSADVLYITHVNHRTAELTRTGHAAWTLTNMVHEDGPYLTTNATTTTLTPSGGTYTAGATVTLTASSVVGINGGTGFQVTDVGRLIRLKEGSTWGYARITSYTSPTVVGALVINSIVNAAAKVSWRLGLYSDTTGYPACSTFFEDRFFLAGSPSQPQRVDGSRTGDYRNFAPTDIDGVVAADHAMGVTLNSDDVQVVRWVKGDEKGLLVGTVEGEWIVRPSTQSEALSPTNIVAKQSTDRGSSDIQALRAGKSVLFVQKAGRTVRELAYVYEVDGFRSPDLTTFWEHVTVGGLKEMAFQKEPQAIVWVVRNDGVLLGFTYERDQKVLGWHRHIAGGYADAAHTTPAEVESVAVIPSADGTRDELWCVVKRYINGAARRHIEFMTRMWERGHEPRDAFYVDGGRVYQGAPTTSLTGLHHLAGETVSVLADGATHPDVVVSALGEVTLVRAASVVAVGYGYNSDAQMLRIDAGAADGTAQGKTQRSHKVVFRLHDSLGLKVGPSFTELVTIPFRSSGDLTDAAVPLFSGDKGGFMWEGGYTTENYVCWRWSQPLPGTVLAVMPQMHTQDR